MKTRYFHMYIGIISLLFLSSSCTKWLDIQPNDRVSSETLFNDPNGFRMALNGIYQQVSEAELYGRNLTWGFASALGNDYYAFQLPVDLREASAPNLTHNNLRGLLKGLWSNSYTVIANCNKLIQEIDKKEDSFFALGDTEKNLIKGEALAMRALLHFDLVRVFAPSPAVDKQALVVPYQDKYPAVFGESLSTTDIMKRITSDLEEAKSLVAKNDTIVHIINLAGGIDNTMKGGASGSGVFFTFRMNRLNFVAINTLLARAYLYAGDIPNAKKTAEFVYKNYGPQGKRWFSFTQEWNTNTSNRFQKLPEDILLAFYDPMLVENIRTYKGSEYTFRLNLNYASFFPASERDYRRNLINLTDNVSYKWLESLVPGSLPQNKILPVVRLSEAYYIYSECLFRENAVNDALTVLNRMRAERGKNNPFQGTTENEYYDELLMEYRREYFTEGQTIFAHKRLNRPMKINTQSIEINNRFTAPVPEEER